MAGNQELFQALQMFSSGVKELQTSRAISQANDLVHQIKGSEADEAAQRAQLYEVSNNLVARLAGMGVPATTIAQVGAAVGPKQYANGDAMIVEGNLSANPGLINQGLAANNQSKADELGLANANRQFMREQQSALFDHQKELMGMKNAGKTGKPLSDKVLASIQEYDAELMQGQDIFSRFEENPDFINVGKNRMASVRGMVNPKFDGFKADLGKWFDAYRKRITGAGATATELKMLMQNVPNIDDTQEGFREKMKNTLRVGASVRERYLLNLQKAGRDVGSYLQDNPVNLPAIAPGEVGGNDTLSNAAGTGTQPAWGPWINPVKR